MKRFKVQSGNIDEIVEAETAGEAAAQVFLMFDDIDEKDEMPSPGAFISTVEVVGKELWHNTEAAIKRAGRWGYTDASSAEKP